MNAKAINGKADFYGNGKEVLNNFFAESEGEIVRITVQKVSESKLRTEQQNKYLWGVIYKYLVTDNFDNEEEAHKYLGGQFLVNTELFEITSSENLTEKINKLSGKFRSDNPIISIQRVGDKAEIKWVRSTASLTTNQFNEYVGKCKDFAAQQGIVLPEPNEVDYE